MKNKFAYRMIM